MVLMKRFTNLGGILKRSNSPAQEEVSNPDADTPEANAARGVRLFCESGAANSGEEVLHLPTIVESAVASPSAAAAAASQIRKFLSKENYTRPHVQYNAVMLIRILADNPGQSFTKNLDKHFAETVKHLLRNGLDPSVSQIVRETLDALEREKAYDTNLNTLFAMWRKEKGLMATAAKNFGPRTLNAPAWGGGGGGGGGGGVVQSQNFSGSRSHSKSRTLPTPVELAGRIEEARTSAKLLLQLVQSTPPQELLGNELVKEFSERCISAQRSMQGYINCDSPPPDDDTMLTLIETNEQLSLAASKHQRAVLQARRLQGPTPTPSPPITTANSNPSYPPAPAPAPVPVPVAYGLPPQVSAPPPSEPPYVSPVDGRAQDPSPAGHKNDDLPLPPSLQAAPGRRTNSMPEEEDPFADHHSAGYGAPSGPPPPRRAEDDDTRLGAQEPYNPNFHSTPSYLGRQESSSNNLTMHGAGPRETEEEQYARDYPPKNGPTTQEAQRKGSDVSPIAERATVTYRY